RVGCGGARLRGGVAEAAEMGGLALAGGGRPQRHACPGRSRGRDRQAEGRARRGDRSRRPDPGADPHRTWPDRRVSDLPAPRRAWPWQALLRRAPAAAPPDDPRSDRRGCGQAELRSRLTSPGLASAPKLIAMCKRSSGGPAMSLVLYGHAFSSYTQKVLIPLYENGTPFEFRSIGPDTPEHVAEWLRRWPLAKFPLLLDGD